MLYSPSLSICTGHPSLDMVSTSNTRSPSLCTVVRQYFLGLHLRFRAVMR